MKTRKEKIMQILTELGIAKINMVSALNHNRDLQTQIRKELRKE